MRIVPRTLHHIKARITHQVWIMKVVLNNRFLMDVIDDASFAWTYD
jgi:hypothetical protein